MNEILTSVREKQKRTLRVEVVDSIYLYQMKTKGLRTRNLCFCEKTKKIARIQDALRETRYKDAYAIQSTSK